MSYFAAVLVRTGSEWRGEETDLADCESLDDLGDVLRDVDGDVRLLLIEQDDEYAVLIRLDRTDDDPRAFLTDGHAADEFPMAAVVAEDLVEIGEEELDEELAADAPPAHDSAPFGDAEIVDDLGTDATALLALCAHEGTLPVDVLLAVCEKAGGGEAFEELRG